MTVITAAKALIALGCIVQSQEDRLHLCPMYGSERLVVMDESKDKKCALAVSELKKATASLEPK